MMHLFYRKLLVPMAIAGIVACTPNIDEVQKAAGPALSRAIGEKVQILQAASDFNEGNGDPSAVLILASLHADPQVVFSLNAQYKKGRFVFDQSRLRKTIRELKTDKILTRRFIGIASGSLSRFSAGAVGWNKQKTLNVTLYLYDAPCEQATCPLFDALSQVFNQFAAQLPQNTFSTANARILFFPHTRFSKAQPKEIIQPLPKDDQRRIDARNAEFVISDLSLDGQVTPAQLRQAISLNAGGADYYKSFQTIRKMMVDQLSRTHGQPFHIQPGGSRLTLIPGFLTKVTHVATVCPKSAMKTSGRCKNDFAFKVEGTFDKRTRTLILKE